MDAIRKIDIHAHAILDELTPPHKMTGERFPTAELLLDKFYDPIGIEKGVLLPMVAPEAQWFCLPNEDAKRICDAHPDRFVWFCNVDPRAGTYAADSDLGYLLRYYKELGARGVGEVTANLYADDPLMDNLFSHCEELGMPVIIHISPAPGVGYGIVDDPGLPRIEKMLKKHPHMTLIGHSQPFWAEISEYDLAQRNAYPRGKVVEGALAKLLRDYDNLHCDLSAGSGCNAMMRDREYAAGFLTEFADRIYYGCDVCISTNKHPFMLSGYLDELCRDGDISEDVYRKVCRENAVRMLKL